MSAIMKSYSINNFVMSCLGLCHAVCYAGINAINAVMQITLQRYMTAINTAEKYCLLLHYITVVLHQTNY